MAQTTTLRAHGAACPSDARFNRPCSSRASRYFISPAWPAAIQRGKNSNSGESSTGATPTSSNPASVAASVTAALISEAESMIDESENQNCSIRQSKAEGSKLEPDLNFFGGSNISSASSAYRLLLTESRNSRCAFSEFL